MDNYQKDVAIPYINQILIQPRLVFVGFVEKKYTSMRSLNISVQNGKVIFLSTKPVYLETGTINAISNSLTNIEKEEKYDQV